MYVAGLDIGTSNIAVVICDRGGRVVHSAAIPNRACIPGEYYESLQDVSIIYRAIKQLLAETKQKFSIVALGISNQMHGIVYVDAKCAPLSPLFTWQDGRGACLHERGADYVQHVYKQTGYHVPSGYALMTHYYNVQNNLVPSTAVRMVDIGTYIAYALALDAGDKTHNNTSQRTPPADIQHAVLHPSNAHAFGFFSAGRFNATVLKTLGMNSSILPRVSETEKPLVYWGGIPVYQSIGDNQAGFLGAIEHEHHDAVLVNVGTSGQITFIDEYSDEHNNHTAGNDIAMEIRPFWGGKKLSVGSALCAGKSISLWVDFVYDVLRSVTTAPSGKEEVCNAVYGAIQKIPLPRDDEADERQPVVKPLFQGTRANPAVRASIVNLDANNFTFSKVSYALMRGIAVELHDMWLRADERTRCKKKKLFLTGGAFKIRSLQRVFQKVFNDIPQCVVREQHEDACTGAAKWAIINLQKGTI